MEFLREHLPNLLANNRQVVHPEARHSSRQEIILDNRLILDQRRTRISDQLIPDQHQDPRGRKQPVLQGIIKLNHREVILEIMTDKKRLDQAQTLEDSSQTAQKLLIEADQIAQEVQAHLLAVQEAVREVKAHLLAVGQEALLLVDLLQAAEVVECEATAHRLQGVGQAALAVAALLQKVDPLKAQVVLEAVAVPAVQEVQVAIAEAVAILKVKETK